MLIQVIKVMWIHANLDADPDPQHWFPYPTIPFTDVLWTIGQFVSLSDLSIQWRPTSAVVCRYRTWSSTIKENFFWWIISNIKWAWKTWNRSVWNCDVWQTQNNIILNLKFDKWKKMQKSIAISTFFLQKIYIWTNKPSRAIQKFMCTMINLHCWRSYPNRRYSLRKRSLIN